MIDKRLIKGLGIGFGVVGGFAVIYYLLKSKGNLKIGGGVDTGFSKDKKMVCSHLTAIENGSKAENNAQNIDLLLDNGIQMIEVDIQVTRDGVPVLFHDNTLDEKTNGSGAIKNQNWSSLKSVRYNRDRSKGITTLEEAIDLIKGKDVILQLDKCNDSEITTISKLGLFKGVENQMLAKGTSFTKPTAVANAGIMWMPMLSGGYVGKMTSNSIIDDIAEKCDGSRFLELSFGTRDTLVLNGTLAKKCSEVGCGLLGVAVSGVETTNPNYYNMSNWGDKKIAWEKYFNQMDCEVVMTNYPLAMKKYLEEKNMFA